MSSSLTAFLYSTTSAWLAVCLCECELACVPQYCVETDWEVEEWRNRRQSLVELRKDQPLTVNARKHTAACTATRTQGTEINAEMLSQVI